ncbi:beta-ketoacyl-ACP synthase III [Prochlorococcus marinus]|uniref:Beta-ketoacyl-[acyl-carrier-protein] synthase III n=1 Tax=Prochlorococcus marinus XMU1408 TaxID=2213228 RepID=A0A318R7P9_PROMR|nr:beta-ketoacyl-ACP synthase III [Prochlorococcus marinus]MBW3041197.1 3-oxoacyl-ACP synthase [Prochlorococcus marinus str. XMU1408]PYE03791.1 3-oxoacyl-ACP synthase [Prochlorococcus marinus XMU1408]
MISNSQSESGISFVGCGSATPPKIINNDQLGQRVDTNDEWIKSRTGIRERRVIGENQSLIDLASDAALKAIKMANWDEKTIDLIILATSTPEDLFGSAPKIQSNLGASNAVAFDLTAACSGFLFALVTASQYLASGSMKRAVVIGADQLSKWVDWDDRKTCVLFGDGAGAVAVEANKNDNGLIGYDLKSDGSRGGCLNLSQSNIFLDLVQGATYQKGEYLPIRMEGKEVYKFAVKEVPIILGELLDKHQIESESIDWLLLHQANQRILDAVASRFLIPSDKVLSNLEHYGNTSAATIPLMLDEAVRDERIKSGDLIACSGFGAGLSWGAALFYWHGPY